MRPVIEGLYAITPDETDTARLMEICCASLQGGARVLQYRNKLADMALRFEQAQLLRALTQEFGVTYIVNDDAQLAKEVDADGVHLGESDGELAAARALLSKDRIIGVSCYNRPLTAQRAQGQGADYVAFGAFFPSSVKPDAVCAEVSMLQAARRELDVPIVAIGGITAQNGAELVQAGADALAVISALWNTPDIAQAAREFNNLFDKA